MTCPVCAKGNEMAYSTLSYSFVCLEPNCGFELEMELAPRMVLLLYDDIPGVIGRVGTLFGAAGVNIANMTVSRNREGGKALMALSIDSTAPADLVEQLREGMDEAYLIV